MISVESLVLNMKSYIPENLEEMVNSCTGLLTLNKKDTNKSVTITENGVQ